MKKQLITWDLRQVRRPRFVPHGTGCANLKLSGLGETGRASIELLCYPTVFSKLRNVNTKRETRSPRNNNIKKFFLTLLIFVTFQLFSQTKVTVDNFFPSSKTKPNNYKTIIFDSTGWTFVATFYFDNKTVSTSPKDIGKHPTLTFNEIKNSGSKMGGSKVKRNKIINYGDGKSTFKIIHVDEHTLILEEKVFKKGKGKKGKGIIISEQTYIKTKARIIYRR